MVYTINCSLVNLLKEKLHNYSKKLGKYGYCSYSVGEPYYKAENGCPYGQMVVDVAVNASYKIEGYEFVAACDWSEEAQENIVRTAGADIEVPLIYKTRTECDHCRVHRFRKHTIILRKRDQYIQVGKSCVKDYLGVDLGSYAFYLSLFETLEDYIESLQHDGIARGIKVWETDYALGQAVALTHQYGYISKSQALELNTDSTASRLWQLLSESRDCEGNLIYPAYKTWNEALVVSIREFYAAREDSTDFIGNIKTVLKQSTIQADQVGLVAAAVGTKARLEVQDREIAQKSTSDFVGDVGERFSFTATPECLYSTESDFGTYYIYRFVYEGNELVWKTTRELNCECEYECVGTIKKHSVYRGTKQTEVTRVRCK